MKEIFYSLINILNEMSPYILLGFLIAGVLHVFVAHRTMARHLSGRGLKPVVKAALFGIPLPLCSCGVLPAAVSLRRRGASRGASTSFLIATPQTGVDSIAATYSLLGLPFAILRPLAALVGATFGGLSVEKLTAADTANSENIADDSSEDFSGYSFGRKCMAALRYGLVDMVASVGKWLVIGLVVAALITVFVPDSFFLSLSAHPFLAMLAVVAVAIPMYVCATGSIPIALSLMMKGLSPGIAFVLLMAGPAANFASVLILRKALGAKATVIYVLSVVATAIAFGLMIDLALPSQWFSLTGMAQGACHHSELSIFSSICSVILIGLLIYATFKSKHHNHNHSHEMERTYKIKGMQCSHCQATVERSISSLEGTEGVTVDLSNGTATVHGNVEPSEVCRVVRLAGFEIDE